MMWCKVLNRTTGKYSLIYGSIFIFSLFLSGHLGRTLVSCGVWQLLCDESKWWWKCWYSCFSTVAEVFTIPRNFTLKFLKNDEMFQLEQTWFLFIFHVSYSSCGMVVYASNCNWTVVVGIVWSLTVLLNSEGWGATKNNHWHFNDLTPNNILSLESDVKETKSFALHCLGCRLWLSP